MFREDFTNFAYIIAYSVDKFEKELDNGWFSVKLLF